MKILLSVLTLFIILPARSQVQVGIFGGPITTNVRYLVKEKKQASDFKFGINTGVQLKFPFEGRMSFAPSLMYNLRGYKVKLSKPAFLPDTNATDNNTNFHTVEVGLLLQHDFNLEPGHLFFRIGPSLDFALIGREKFNTKSSTFVDRNMKFSFSDYGHYLASAIFQFGYEMKNGTYFYGHYNYSLTSMNNADGGPKIGNRAVGITIGKYFGSKGLKMDTGNKQ